MNFEDFTTTGAKTDKITQHGYHRFYPWFLSHFRDKSVNLLEIGIEETESLKLWRGYFKSLKLVGIDIDQKDFDDDAVILHKLDQSNTNHLEDFVKNISVQFDIIIDDGSHVPDHQLLTLSYMWSILKPSGVYIIEDIETSYWGKSQSYGYKFNASKSSVIYPFKDLIDIVNVEFSGAELENKYLKNLAYEVEMVTFCQNCIILVKKDFGKYSNFYGREYRSKNRINSRKFVNLVKRAYRKYIAGK